MFQGSDSVFKIESVPSNISSGGGKIEDHDLSPKMFVVSRKKIKKYQHQNGHKVDVHFRKLVSKVAKHAKQSDHKFDFDNVVIFNRTKNYHKPLFLEAWHFLKHCNPARNDHIDVPDVYKSV